MGNVEKAGLYIHVPFCRTKCPYCNFYSVTSLSTIPHWLDALRKEISLYGGRSFSFDSLYVGGGTPTLLADHDLATVMHCLLRHFTFDSSAEITIEANPDDVTLQKLAFIRDLGINRINLGVQSFHDRELQSLGRRHTAWQAMRALDCIRSAGFSNVGIDLIYGLTRQTESDWLQNLRCALAYEPEHISCYQMTIEEGTPFGDMLAGGLIQPLPEEGERSLFLLTSRFLQEQGYLHYEISNFARSEEHTCRHNRKYWRHVPYLGLGPAAHSFRDGVRWWNVRSVESYCKNLANDALPIAGNERLSEEQYRLETLYLGLRTTDGIHLELVRKELQSSKILGDLQELSLLRIQGDKIFPTCEGFLVADSLALFLAD